MRTYFADIFIGFYFWYGFFFGPSAMDRGLSA